MRLRWLRHVLPLTAQCFHLYIVGTGTGRNGRQRKKGSSQGAGSAFVNCDTVAL